ncbi:MAG: FtsX-like permease family protein [Candidatus Limnocylindria bacterium]
MRSIRLFGLGVRIALTGGRASVIRMALMALGLAVGIALLLGALSVGPAVGARRDREVARYGQTAPPDQIRDVAFRWQMDTRFEGVSIPVVALSGVGDAPAPPGIPRLPRPGEVYVSPALADLLAGPDGPLLAPRLPGSVAGTIADEGLLSPGELYGYVAAPAGLPIERLGIPQRSFAVAERPSEDMSLFGLLVLCVFVLGLLLPIGLFIVTTTRLSASTREMRLAAVRLAGATQSQVRLLAAAESALAAIVACVLAWPLFLFGRIVVSRITIFGYRWFPGDFAPPSAGALVLLVGVPLFAVFVTMLGIRRLVVSPLGIARGERRPRRVPLWLWPSLLASGFLLLAGSVRYPDALLRLPSPIPGVIVGGALAMVLAGLAGTVPWLGWLGARALAGWGPTPSVLLGSRRLESEPTSAGRVVAGITMLLALVGMAQALALSAMASSEPGYVRPWAEALPASTVFVSSNNGHDRAADFEALRSVPGVRSVSVGAQLPTGGHGAQGSHAVVSTDGNPATLERIRNELAWVGFADTLDELRADYGGGSSEALRASRMMNFVTILVLLVTAASLLVSTVDGMMERRRPMAVLSAIGVPLSVMRRSVFVQIALPLAAALVLGVAASLGVVAFFFRAVGETGVFPMRPLLLTAAAVTAMVVLVTALALPWARVARRPELLRNE